MADLGPDQLSAPGLHVQLIGRFQLFRRPATTPLRLPAGKATTLAQLLVVRRGSFVSVDTIVETLWGDEPPPAAAQNVASLVSRLRRVVGPDAISGGRSGYRFEPARCVVDVDVAERLVGEAEAQLRSGRPALAASAATQARATLERGAFLEDEPYALWAEGGRRQAERLARQARRAAWRAALALDDYGAALEVATRAVEANPLDEEAHRARMEAFYRSGDAGAALAAYEQLRSTLVDELGADPSPQSEVLYLAILRAEPLPRPHVDGRVQEGPGRAESDGLVGRDEELAVLIVRWTAAAAGDPGVAVITGAAGSGKTVVCREVARQARTAGAAVLWSTCHEAERSLFLQPLLEALRTFLGAIPPGRVRSLAGEWAGTLGELMPDVRTMLAVEHYERATPEIEHRRSLEAVGGVLQNIARQQPVLVILDDVHHAGASTLEAVHFIRDRLVSEPVLVLLSVASEAAPDVLKLLGRSAVVVSLGPLSIAAVERLARRFGGRDLSLEDLHARTGGNPQFVVEALRSAAEGVLVGQPESLRATVLDRVQRAGREVEDLLRVAAVAGSTFELEFVADLASIPDEDAAEWAERAMRAGLLDADSSRFRFAGSLIRDALYATTPGPIRTSRHRRAAAKLADRPEAAAAHHAAAGDWDRAHQAWWEAAEQAIRSFAIRDGERLLAEAVAAAERAADRRALARARIRRGQLREELADYEGAQQDHSAALAIAAELGDDALEAQALERLGWTAYYGRDSAAAGELAARATELAESAAAAPAALPSALVLVGRIRHWAGDVDGAAEAYEEALAREPDPATSASALSCLGALLEHGDRFTEARRTLDLASAEAARTGAFRPLLRTLFFAGLARGNLGDFGGARRALERKRRLLEEYEVHFYRARTDTLLSWVWREVGELARARDLAEQAVEEAREVQAGSLQVEQELHGLLGAAECALLAADEDGAAALVAQAEPLLSGWLPFRWRAELRFREVRCRLLPKEAEELLELARQRRSRKYEALALAHLDRRSEAATIAASTGSELLVAEVAPLAQARQAFDRLAAALPVELREGFVSHGRVAGMLAQRA
jgi:DNA-binding SARP family transcriptional activator